MALDEYINSIYKLNFFVRYNLLKVIDRYRVNGQVRIKRIHISLRLVAPLNLTISFVSSTAQHTLI